MVLPPHRFGAGAAKKRRPRGRLPPRRWSQPTVWRVVSVFASSIHLFRVDRLNVAKHLGPLCRLAPSRAWRSRFVSTRVGKVVGEFEDSKLRILRRPSVAFMPADLDARVLAVGDDQVGQRVGFDALVDRDCLRWYTQAVSCLGQDLNTLAPVIRGFVGCVE